MERYDDIIEDLLESLKNYKKVVKSGNTLKQEEMKEEFFADFAELVENDLRFKNISREQIEEKLNEAIANSNSESVYNLLAIKDDKKMYDKKSDLIQEYNNEIERTNVVLTKNQVKKLKRRKMNPALIGGAAIVGVALFIGHSILKDNKKTDDYDDSYGNDVRIESTTEAEYNYEGIEDTETYTEEEMITEALTTEVSTENNNVIYNNNNTNNNLNDNNDNNNSNVIVTEEKTSSNKNDKKTTKKTTKNTESKTKKSISTTERVTETKKSTTERIDIDREHPASDQRLIIPTTEEVKHTPEKDPLTEQVHTAKPKDEKEAAKLTEEYTGVATTYEDKTVAPSTEKEKSVIIEDGQEDDIQYFEYDDISWNITNKSKVKTLRL